MFSSLDVNAYSLGIAYALVPKMETGKTTDAGSRIWLDS